MYHPNTLQGLMAGKWHSYKTLSQYWKALCYIDQADEKVENQKYKAHLRNIQRAMILVIVQCQFSASLPSFKRRPEIFYWKKKCYLNYRIKILHKK